MLNGLKHGKGNLYDRNDNIKYEGDFIKDRFEGIGKYIYEEGEYFFGKWLNGLKHGTGTIYYKNGKIKFDGNYINDKREGYGEYFWEDGEYYKGIIKMIFLMEKEKNIIVMEILNMMVIMLMTNSKDLEDLIT